MKHTSKAFGILALIIFCATVICSQKIASSSRRAKDAAAIKAALEQMRAGWNAKSGAAFTKPFTENADAVVINGVHIKTRAEIARFHQTAFDGIFKDVRLLEYNVEQIRFLRPDVALVHVVGVRDDVSDKTKTKRGRLSFVMVKNRGEWQIEFFQNTAIEQQ
jgi:uncharacterized protein (TIGR02246 family)